MSDELEIPERALKIACDVYDAALIRDIDNDERPVRECAEMQAVRAAVPIIVATELRQLAEILWEANQLSAAIRLAERADQLDPVSEDAP